MKKILALAIALMMLLAAIPAFADSLEIVPGTPSTCTFAVFQTYFTVLSSGSGYEFTWADAPAEENGYTVYSADAGDGTLTIKVYTLNDTVVYTVAEGSAALDVNDSDSANTFGQWFGVAVSGSVVSLCMGEGNTSILSDSNLEATLQADITPLVDILMNDFDEASLAKGKAATSLVLGYPAGLEVSGGAVGTLVNLNMKIVVTSADGQLNVVQ